MLCFIPFPDRMPLLTSECQSINVFCSLLINNPFIGTYLCSDFKINHHMDIDIHFMIDKSLQSLFNILFLLICCSWLDIAIGC